MNIYKIFEGVLDEGAKSVLDIGCGICRTLGRLPIPVKVGLDIWRPYLEKARDEAGNGCVLVHGDAMRLGDLFVERSFDVVTLLDVVEHFEKSRGKRLIEDAERLARMQVVVFAPRGKDPQEGDVYGLGGEKYQTHRSQWEPEDLKAMGYRVMVLEEFHEQKGVDAILAYKKVGGQP